MTTKTNFMGYKVSDSQAKKIAMALKSYSINLWENNEKVDMFKVQSIIDDILIR